MPKIKTYHFTNDPGHGWLHVKREELVRLGIADKISSYSYQRGGTVYLEEDCDATLFINTKWGLGERVVCTDRYVDRTPIRGYEPYQHEGEQANV